MVQRADIKGKALVTVDTVYVVRYTKADKSKI